jgi:hypothetical protein
LRAATHKIFLVQFLYDAYHLTIQTCDNSIANHQITCRTQFVRKGWNAQNFRYILSIFTEVFISPRIQARCKPRQNQDSFSKQNARVAMWKESQGLTRQTSAAVARARSSGDVHAAANRELRERRNTDSARACRSPRAVRAAAGHRPPTRSGRIADAHSPWLTITTSSGTSALPCCGWCWCGDGGGRSTWQGSQTLMLGPRRRGVPAADGCGESGESAAWQGSTSGSCSSTLEADEGAAGACAGGGGAESSEAEAVDGSSSSSSAAVETEEWEECAEPMARGGGGRRDLAWRDANWGSEEQEMVWSVSLTARCLHAQIRNTV